MADTLITGTTLVEKESRSVGDVPIGAIVSWAKNFSGVGNLSESFRECDGSVIIDALSPLNGQTLPDLNGDNRFMRGNSTSGGIGGAATSSHNHSIPNGNDAEVPNDGTQFLGLTGTDTGNSSPSIIPPFYSIVWVMRIR